MRCCVGLQVYNFYSLIALLYLVIHEDRKTSIVTQMYTKATGEIVTEERIRYFTEFGGVPVQISRDEVGTIKKCCNGNPDRASLLLLGFKPLPTAFEAMSSLKMIDKSMFAYPNNNIVEGSKAAFATLHASMIRKNVMGIGELLLRVTAMSKLVAIIPQKEERFDEQVGDDEEIISHQVAPPGFLLIPLAFQENMRALPRKHNYVPEKNMVDAAKDLIRHQNLEGSIEIGQSFENPVLKKFWNYIESVALGTPLDEDVADDDTKMNVDEILAFAGDKIHAFKSTIPKEEVTVASKVLPRKRKTAKELPPDETGIDWTHEYEMDTFHELTIVQLKSYLKSVGEPISGKKNDLINRIKDHFESCNTE